MVQHEEGFIACCSLCDSYFVFTTGLISPSQWGGREGKANLDARNERTQLSWAAKRWSMLRCPTCVELISGLQFLDWLERHMRDMTILTPLSPCFVVGFEEHQPPPLFMDHHPSGEAGKPKWRLASGVGPAGLELDNSRSGRLWKPSLRAAGIDAPRYEASSAASIAGRDFHANVLLRVAAALEAASDADEEAVEASFDALAETLHAARPLYASWPSMEERVEAIITAHERDVDARHALARLAVRPPDDEAGFVQSFEM